MEYSESENPDRIRFFSKLGLFLLPLIKKYGSKARPFADTHAIILK